MIPGGIGVDLLRLLRCDRSFDDRLFKQLMQLVADFLGFGFILQIFVTEGQVHINPALELVWLLDHQRFLLGISIFGLGAISNRNGNLIWEGLRPWSILTCMM